MDADWSLIFLDLRFVSIINFGKFCQYPFKYVFFLFFFLLVLQLYLYLLICTIVFVYSLPLKFSLPAPPLFFPPLLEVSVDLKLTESFPGHIESTREPIGGILHLLQCF